MTAEPWSEFLLSIWRDGQQLGAVGPGPVEQHLEHAQSIASQLSAPTIAVDLGAGAGIPGLALAGIWPDSRWLLLDAAARRVRLLKRAVDQLGWNDRVSVRHGRAEDVAHESAWRTRADLVIARSFGPPAVTAECGTGFLSPAGLFVVAEPPSDDETDRWPTDGLHRLALTSVPAPSGVTGVRLQRLRRSGTLPDELPRRAGVPERRPRFG